MRPLAPVTSGDGRVMCCKPRLWLAIALGLLSTGLWTMPAEAEAFCDGGHKSFVPGQLHRHRHLAEERAVKVWREEQAKTHGKDHAANLFVLLANIKCMATDDGKAWRCYVKTVRCVAT